MKRPRMNGTQGEEILIESPTCPLPPFRAHRRSVPSAPLTIPHARWTR